MTALGGDGGARRGTASPVAALSFPSCIFLKAVSVLFIVVMSVHCWYLLSNSMYLHILVLALVQGSTLEGWPIQMGEVQGQVFVADLNSDGEVEIFAGEDRTPGFSLLRG